MIRTRLTLWNVILFALALTFIGAVVYFTTRAALYRSIDEDLSRRAEFLDHAWPDGPGHGPGPAHGGPDGPDGPDHHHGDGPPPMPPQFLSNIRQFDPIQAQRLEFTAGLTRPRIVHLDKTNHDGHPDDEPFDATAIASGKRGQRVFTVTTMLEHRIRVYTLPLHKDGKRDAVAQFAANLDDVDAVVRQMRVTMLALLPIALLMTYLLGLILTNRALRPVRDIADAAGRIEASSLSDRLPVTGKDEFAELSIRFNTMLGRIEASYQDLELAYEAQRRFVADASHELKTPLTAIKGRVGLAQMKRQTVDRYQEHIEAIGRSTDSMAAIIQDLLLLAHSDERKLHLQRTSCLFRSVAESAIEEVAAEADRVVLEGNESIRILADPALFKRVLVNLLSNALRHSEGTVVLRANQTGALTQIDVVDTGEGIPAEHVPHLFERFYRVDESRYRGTGGSGLGLAIVKSIVVAHHGEVSIASEVGRGTTVSITLSGD